MHTEKNTMFHVQKMYPRTSSLVHVTEYITEFIYRTFAVGKLSKIGRNQFSQTGPRCFAFKRRPRFNILHTPKPKQTRTDPKQG